MRCWVFPRPDPLNPYQELLAAALRRRGIAPLAGGRLTPLWAARVPAADAVHLHWVEFLIHSERGGPLLRDLYMGLRAASLIAGLAVLRLRRIRVVWTVHNLAAHEPRHPRLERVCMRAVARLASCLHVHSHWAGRRAVAELGLSRRGKVLVGRHGHYIEAYGPAASRAASRRALGLGESAHVYLLFGAIRPYKRVVETIAEFRRLADREAVLIVAGRVGDPRLRGAVEAAAGADARVVLRLGFVPEDDVAKLFAAADAAIVNYAEVFSSGALMAALSAGTPVVAPAGGTTAEIASSPAVEEFAPGDLAAALERVLDGDPEERRAAALAAAEACGWDELAGLLAPAFGAEQIATRQPATAPG